MQNCKKCGNPMVIRKKVEKENGVWELHYFCDHRGCDEYEKEQLVITEGEAPKKKAAKKDISE